MKKELSLAFLGISLGLASVPVSALVPELGQPPVGGVADGQIYAQISPLDIEAISACVADRDVLCLRAILAANPTLIQCDLVAPAFLPLCQALANFWIVSATAEPGDIFGDLVTIIALQGETEPPQIYV